MAQGWTVRVDVDTQNGFCDPRGGLAIAGAEAVVPLVAALNREAIDRGMVLIGSVDTHDYASPEFVENGGRWPRHCVKGTWDWLKPPSTLPDKARFVGREPTDVIERFASGEAALYFEKDAYSLFDNQNADALLVHLRERAAARGAALLFEVYGVATDVCVKAAALELARRGERVRVLADATRGVTPEGHRAALEELTAAGVEVAEGLAARGV